MKERTRKKQYDDFENIEKYWEESARFYESLKVLEQDILLDQR